MRVLQLSDVHGSKRAALAARDIAKSQGAELIVLAGDITTFGSVSEVKGILEVLASSGARVLYVPGNCDPPELMDLELEIENVIGLHARAVEVGGLRIGGVGGGLFADGATWIELTEEELEEEMRPLGRVDVLVSHTPPHGTDADLLRGSHVGSRAVRDYCERHSPVLVSCGHIHEAKSVSRLGRTYVVNAGPAKSGNAALITLDGKNIEVELTSLFGR
ncbi:MAG: metallophosphoesterase family protein [Nitrososphaerota archaeon]|nr:metallophosphoesterase family protein [Nitrososphaerota archaeon]